MAGETAQIESALLTAQIEADDARDAAIGRRDRDTHGHVDAFGSDQSAPASCRRDVSSDQSLSPLRRAQG